MQLGPLSKLMKAFGQPVVCMPFVLYVTCMNWSKKSVVAIQAGDELGGAQVIG